MWDELPNIGANTQLQDQTHDNLISIRLIVILQGTKVTPSFDKTNLTPALAQEYSSPHQDIKAETDSQPQSP